MARAREATRGARACAAKTAESARRYFAASPTLGAAAARSIVGAEAAPSPEPAEPSAAPSRVTARPDRSAPEPDGPPLPPPRAAPAGAADASRHVRPRGGRGVAALRGAPRPGRAFA